MRRLFFVSICTLVLSLSSVLNIVSDNQTNTAAYAAENTDTNIKKVTPTETKPDEVDKAAVKKADTKKTQNNDEKETAAKETASMQEVAGVSAAPNSSENVAKKTNTTDINQMIYNGIDLSQCDNAVEVVRVLEQNGCDNINLNNIKDSKRLREILDKIQPTTEPAVTAAPKPTTKPVATAAPKPTTKPVATAAPKPTTKPVATATPKPTTNTGISNYANEVLRLVNIERSKAGLSALTTNSTLTAAANKRAQETVQSFSHTRPNGTGFQTALTEFGVSYRAAGENIAYGQRTPQEVVTGWMNSPGHRANILNANFNKIGIGVYQKNGVIYWSQLFTN